MNKKRFMKLFIGSIILSFGLYNIHSLSNVTEGGTLGASLLLHYWFNISPAISVTVINIICYLIGWKVLGKDFLISSFVATIMFGASYYLFEIMGPVYPEIQNHPYIASVIGALFVGVGVGICINEEGATAGEDALALIAAEKFHCNVKWIYLITDTVVLLLSLTYINSTSRILSSAITVILSGQIIGEITKGKSS